MVRDYYPEINYFDFDDLVKNYTFNATCQKSVPQAIYCFLISKNFEDCLRTSVSIGGDTDTLCAMSCAIAEAFYNDIPFGLAAKVLKKLPFEMRRIIEAFYGAYEDPDFSPILKFPNE